MKNLYDIDFIENLAESTHHFDQELIRRSLLEALDKYSVNSDYLLYRVDLNSSQKTMTLMALSEDDEVDTFRMGKADYKLEEYLYASISSAVKSHLVIKVEVYDDGGKLHYIYPSYDSNNDIFAVLVQTSPPIDKEHQRLVHALLNLYTNYLSLIDKSNRDKLTNLLNRETLDNEISQILFHKQNHTLVLSKKSYKFTEQREAHNNHYYWLGVLDIDFFKLINDNYGHLYGDEVLILVSRLIEKNVRDFDLVFRYGGEEFVILLKAPDITVAKLAFERMRKEIQKYPFAKVEQLTVSIGATQITNQSGTAEIIGNADEALYYAKENGRNQLHFYEELVQNNIIEPSNEESEDSDIDFF